MTVALVHLLATAAWSAACGELEVPYNGIDDDCDVATLDDDLDRDGWPASEDCNDLDPRYGAVERLGDGLDNDCDPATPDADVDGDGLPVPADCDDADPAVPATDADCDGVPTSEDCDDADAGVGSSANDGDCDGVPSFADCDDADPAAGDRRQDGDCDGVPRRVDCDDASPERGDRSLDDDCDGVPSLLDCAPDDRHRTGADDADCDGVVAADDCDDADAGRGRDDADCDGVAWFEDCDDASPALGAVADDGDCDGLDVDVDCDDGDPHAPARDDDLDCDGVPDARDCDDASVLVGASDDDRDCDGIPWFDDCDDADAWSTIVATDADCDGVLTAADCDDADRFALDHAIDLDCDNFVGIGDCVEGDPSHHVGARLQVYEDANCSGETDLKLQGAHVTWAADGGLGSWGAPLGDLDGDGAMELALGVPGAGDGGVVYILPLGGHPDWSDLWAPDVAMTTIVGAADTAIGRRLSSGDVDGDGAPDLLVAGDGVALLFLAAQLSAGGPLYAADAVATWTIDDAHPRFIGDVDGDGLEEMVIDDPVEAFLVWGADLDSRVPFVPASVGDGSSSWVGSAGDVDGDGLVDLAAGAPATGRVHIVSGARVSTEVDLGSADWVIDALQRTDGAYTFTPLGDLDLDGHDDVGVFEWHADDWSGRLSLLSGRELTLGQVRTLSDALATMVGGDKNHANTHIAPLDADADGRIDLLIGQGQPGPRLLLFDDYMGLDLGDWDASIAFGSNLGGYEWVVAPGDVDADGRDDLLVGKLEDHDGQEHAYLIYAQF